MTNKKYHLILIAAIILVAGTFYLITLSPTVTLIDCGELAIVCKTLGIAHPTGYPLYTLIGRLATFMGFKPNVLCTNMLSMIFSICALICLYFLILLTLKFTSNKKENENRFISLAGSLTFAFSLTFWNISVVTEVYSLTVFLSVLLCVLIFIWRKTRDLRTFFLFTFLFGLAFGNHLLIFIFIPAFLFLILATDFTIVKRPKIIGIATLLIVFSLTIYIYLPLRSSQSPLMNWGDPVNSGKFFRHISGWQYRVWMFTKTPNQLLSELKNYALLLKDQFTPYLLIFIPFGLIYLFRKNKTLLVFFLIIWFGNIIYASNYDIPDIAPYFLPSFLVSVIIISMGIKFLLSFIKFGYLKYFILLLPIVPLVFNIEPSNFHHKLYEEMSKNLLKFPEENSLVIMDNWDYYSPSIYMQHIEGFRDDVVLVDFELLRRSWYIEGLLKNYPEIFNKAEREMKDFLVSLKPFERQEKYNAYYLQRDFVNMISSFVRKNMEERHVYTTFKEKEGIFKDFEKIPVGLLYELHRSGDSVGGTYYYPIDIEEFETTQLFDSTIYWDDRTKSVMSIYTRMWGDRSNFLYGIKKLHRVKEYLELACKMEPHNIIYWQNLAVITMELKHYDEALIIFEKMASLFPEKEREISLAIQDVRRRMDSRLSNPTE
ncbi:DUF2723 domain-containing protein [bacterium]|nr:DUF2723 domain-containing protein [bacterium]